MSHTQEPPTEHPMSLIAFEREKSRSMFMALSHEQYGQMVETIFRSGYLARMEEELRATAERLGAVQ